jgi:glycine/serine hydroxymethyltransferase
MVTAMCLTSIVYIQDNRSVYTVKYSERSTDLRYYEACTSAEIYEHLEKAKTPAATPVLVR